MPILLNRMLFPEQQGEIVVHGERVRVLPDQIIVWVSLSRRSLTEANPATDPFPAILDTGHNHSFAITTRHLIEWADLNPDELATRGAVRDRGQRIELRQANIWVHPNESGKREEFALSGPFRLKAKQGIAVYPEGDFPRLPILGLRAIAENGLVLKVDGARREATLRTPTRWWPFSLSRSTFG